jgi:hypothetical protein
MMDAPASLSVHAVKATKLPASIVDVIERLPSFKFLPDDGRDIPPPLTLQDSSHLFEQIPAAIKTVACTITRMPASRSPLALGSARILLTRSS